MRVAPIRRATSPLWVGRIILTAMSASPRARSWLRLLSASSIAMPGLRARKPANIAGSASAPMISLDVTLTTPRSIEAADEADRASAVAAAAIASACGTRAVATAVAFRPRGERVNSVAPSASSSASIWRPTVGWVRPSRRAAPLRLRSRATSRKVRSSSQAGSRRLIRKCIAGVDKYAIPQEPGRAYQGVYGVTDPALQSLARRAPPLEGDQIDDGNRRPLRRSQPTRARHARRDPVFAGRRHGDPAPRGRGRLRRGDCALRPRGLFLAAVRAPHSRA